eukprot:4341334-Karenia_brevis.AAC.1
MCRQAFGTDDSARRAFGLLSTAVANMDFEAYARQARVSIASANRNEEGSISNAQRPRPPQNVHPLCHHLLGGPPDFPQLFDRRMHLSLIHISEPTRH